MDSDTLISFIIPVFNAEKTLVRCLESIVNQTSKGFEIILINDGSRDGSQSIIDKYATDYPNCIKSYSKSNGGPGETRNLGIKKATGLYIAFVDSDDFLEKNYIEVTSQHIKAHEPDMLIINYNRIYQKKPNIFEKTYKFSTWNYYNEPFYLQTKPEIICKIEMASWLRIIKRDIIVNNNLLFNDYMVMEDLEASLKWYLFSEKILISNVSLYNYIINSNTLNTSVTYIQHCSEVLLSVYSYYKEKERLLEYYDEIEYILTKHLLLANIIRLLKNKKSGNLDKFLKLRSTLIDLFPHFQNNRYLIEEPMYVRVAIYAAYYIPRIFYFFI